MSANQPLKRRRSETAPAGRKSRLVSRHRVRDAIHQIILTRSDRPGQKLVQEQLARELNVSRGVVREALMELKSSGLVETIDNCGVVVSRMNREKLIECFELREMHEALAVRRCCARITVQQLRELRALAREIHRVHRRGRRRAGAHLDQQFHQRLIQIAHHHLLTQLASAYWVLGKIVTDADADINATRKGHLAILQAIAHGNEDEAEKLIREHIRIARCHFKQKSSKDASFMPEWLNPASPLLTGQDRFRSQEERS
ncbi:MAG: GntR family transcriptional regulator [Verrucomicrobia bacterium]|nr:GntR family transcriptional regulator [Verrucomicrobiota bacterium]